MKVEIVVRGPQGLGKTLLAQWLGELFSRLGLVVEYENHEHLSFEELNRIQDWTNKPVIAVRVEDTAEIK